MKAVNAVVAAVIVISGAVWAEEPATGEPYRGDPDIGEPVRGGHHRVNHTGDGDRQLTTRAGMSFELGGGGGDFVSEAARDITNPAGLWTARLTIGTRSIIGAELGYIGSAQNVNALGLDDNALLVSNGAEGALRLNFLTGTWQPYVSAGVAWRRYSLLNTSSNTSSVRNQDDMGEVPVSLGIAYRNEGFVADLRGTYRQAFEASLFPGVNMSTWGGTARVGFEF